MLCFNKCETLFLGHVLPHCLLTHRVAEIILHKWKMIFSYVVAKAAFSASLLRNPLHDEERVFLFFLCSITSHVEEVCCSSSSYFFVFTRMQLANVFRPCLSADLLQFVQITNFNEEPKRWYSKEWIFSQSWKLFLQNSSNRTRKVIAKG